MTVEHTAIVQMADETFLKDVKAGGRVLLAISGNRPVSDFVESDIF